MGVCAGRRRVDLALINGHLDGWEIKSDTDSLRRLDGQIEAYSSVMDRSWIVVTQRHLVAAELRLPAWWGVMLATHDRLEKVQLTQLRRPRQSPVLDSMSIAQLLWREEAVEVLRAHGLAQGLSGMARWYVWDRLASSVNQTDLRKLVRTQLRARQDWPGGRQPS